MIRPGVSPSECRCLEHSWVSFLCLDVCFSFAELKRGISLDSTSSPKLDRYKIAKQLTEKAIKVNALPDSVGRGTF